jgi:hypothetical protein
MPRTARLLAVFGLLVCIAILPGRAIAQASGAAASTSFHATSAAGANFATEEVTLSGTIEKAIPASASGKPRALYLILSGPRGTIDANVGPYLPAKVQESLAAGQHIEVTGVSRTFNGKNHFLVRQLTVAGQQVTVRNERGFLVRPRNAGAARAAWPQTLMKGENP